MPSASDTFEHISKSILSGNAIASVEAANKALESGISIHEIILNGILKAWSEFVVWDDRNSVEASKAWFDCYNASQKVLQSLDATIGSPKDPPFSVLVATVLGEGHITMRDIVTILLRSKGLKVYAPKRGVRIDDVSEVLSDPKLKFVVLSCIQLGTEAKLRAFIDGVRERRGDVAIIAGGTLAVNSGADLIVNDPAKLVDSLLEYG